MTYSVMYADIEMDIIMSYLIIVACLTISSLSSTKKNRKRSSLKGKKLKREYQNDHVTSTTGMPDFVIFNKGTKFVELKPCRLSKNQRASFERMYLSLTQEITILFLLNCGAYVGIRYYIKTEKTFTYSKVIKLSSKNLKRFCLSTPWEERTDPDDLF